jgi:integrase
MGSAPSTYPTKGGFMSSVLLDVAGHRRSPATMPGYHNGRPPRNKGEQYPADPPTVEEIVAVMRSVGDRSDGHRLRTLIVLLWRAGLRISEALALQESDLDRSRGAVLVRRGKGGKRREVGMDRWAWDQLDPWLEIRRREPSAARKQLHHAAARAGVRRRFAPHQLRHAHAVEMAQEGVPLVVIQRQLGHYAGDPVKRAERDRVREAAFQAARRRPPGVLVTPVWINAA